MNAPIVSTLSGQVQGKTSRNIRDGVFYSFQGVPYAKPPIGDLRFKDPKPVEPWSGVRDATENGQECVQKHPILGNFIGSEDCLFLNIYTPNIPSQEDGRLRPVMVFIHGGGFTSGSNNPELYGPEILLTEDIVLVNINYRTAIFGFLTFEDESLNIPGNAGLKDMVLALKWIQDNISNFSGDPSNVTIFGESAGGAACHYLILSPMGKGLFHKAILQSGCSLNIWARGRNYSRELAKVLDLDTHNEREIFKKIMEMDSEELYLRVEKIPDEFIASQVRPHGPIIEKPGPNAFLCEEPLALIKAGKYHEVPMIIGYNTREGMLSEILQQKGSKGFRPHSNFELTVPFFLNMKPNSDHSKITAQKIRQFYYGNEEPSERNKDSFYLLDGDNFFTREVLLTVEYHAERSTLPVYLYRMSVETSLNMLKNIYGIKEKGVCHGDDIAYLFTNLITSFDLDSKEDIASRQFVKLWTNFAKTGDPNPKEKDPLIDVNWKPVTKDTKHFLDIGDKLTVGVNPEQERLDFWKPILKTNAVINKL